jgi:type IV pilus assembly protein PilQ
MIIRLFLIIFITFFPLILTAAEPINLDVQDANLADTLEMLAKSLSWNMILNPNIQGEVTLHLTNASPEAVFQLLLTSHGLGTARVKNVVYVAPQSELIAAKEKENQWRQLSQEAIPLASQSWKLNYAKADEMLRLINDPSHGSLLSNRGHINADGRTNTLYAQDIPSKLILLDNLVRRTDAPVSQVIVAAKLVSVDQEYERQLGLDYLLRGPSQNNLVEMGHYSLALLKLADSAELDIRLAALENEGHAELISSPRLFALNQQAASIEAGEEVPYQETSESGGTAVEFKKAVLALRIVPSILPKGKILLQLSINQDRPTNSTVLGMPTISTRQIMTSILAKNGQTVVLGGIYETDQEKSNEQVPFLSKVPLFGVLFKQQNIRETKRELLIFITPTIVA